jgi:mRNA interferase RelE/StbE
LTWQINWDDRARKELRSLDKPIQKKILEYLRSRVSTNPLSFGKELLGNKAGLRSYRIESYRIICQIQDESLTILVVAVGHRKDIYDG